ncbi:MAG: hypothetical protein WCU74_05545 [Candidatus Omnitrophota bacterium]
MKGSMKVLIRIAILAALVLVYVHEHVMLLNLSYVMNRETLALNEKTETFRRLKFQVDQLKAPRLLETKMKELSLDLIPPTEIKVVCMRAGRQISEAEAQAIAMPTLADRLNGFLGRWISVAQAKTEH